MAGTASTGRANAYSYRLTAIATLGGFLFGYDTAIISGTTGFVARQFGLDAISLGWFVSCALLGCVIGVAYTGVARDRYGTKPLLILSAALFTISGIGCMLPNSFSMLVLFRFLGGLGIGMASMLSPLYIAEIAPSAQRGRLVAFYQLAITIGIVAAYFVNAALLNLAASMPDATGLVRLIFVDEVWRAMLGSGALPALLFILSLPSVPESPRWMVLHGKPAKALAVLERVNGPEAARTELAEIETTLATEKEGIASLFGRYRLPAILGIALAILQQFSGINAVIYYGPDILERAGMRIGDALGGQVIIGFVNVLGTFIAVATVDRFGRRPLLLGGAIGIVLSLALIGLLFRAETPNPTLLIGAIMLFIACFSLSYGPVVWILLSELFPTHVRGVGMSIATLALWLGTAAVGQITPWFLDVWGPSATFWFFAACTVPAIYLSIFVLPETKGRSLEEIERSWRR